MFYLAVTKGRLGRYDEAYADLKHLHEINLTHYPPGHPALVGSMLQLAQACTHWAGKSEEAEQLYTEALVAVESRCGANDVRVARVLVPLGRLLASCQRTSQSRTMLARAVKIVDEDPHATLLDRASAHEARAQSLSGRENLADAEREIRTAIDLLRRAYPADHPDLLSFESTLGLVLYQRGDLEDFAACAASVLDRRIRVLGEQHPDVSEARFNLALAQLATGHLQAAFEGMSDAVPKLTAVYGSSHPRASVFLDQLVNVGDRLAREGMLDECEEAYLTAFDALSQDQPGDPMRRKQVASKLAHHFRSLGDEDQAERWQAEAEAAADEPRQKQ
jgi:tetratricopeptide (TPR) repeat protein